MDHLDPDFLVGNLLQAGLDRLGGTPDVGLDHQVQLLHFALLHLGEEVIQSDLGVQLGEGVLRGLTALLHQLPGHALVGNGVKRVAGSGHFGKTGDLHGLGGTCGLHGAALVVGHDTDTAHSGAGDDDIALLQGAVLHQQCGNGTTGLVQTGFDDGALGGTVGVGLQLLNLGGQNDHFQQLVDAGTLLGGDGADDGLAAVLLGDQIVLHQALANLVGVGTGLIHLVDGNDDGNFRGFRVVDGLHGLGHDAVVRCHHQNGNVGTHGAALTHGSKCGVTGGVQEGDGIAVDLDGVRADVLGDAAGLAGSNVGLADGIQKAGLAVVDVTHDHHHGRTAFQLLGGIHMIVDDPIFDGDGDFLFHLAAHFGCHKFGGVEIDGLVDAGHDAVFHQQLDDFTGGLFHLACQLAHGDFLGDLHGDGSLPGDLHLEAAHLLLLLVPGLAALELVVLLVLLLLFAAADLLLAAGEILGALGDQAVHTVVKPGGVDLHSRGVHHPALPLAFRLPGLLGTGRLRTAGLLNTALLPGSGLLLPGLLGYLLGFGFFLFGSGLLLLRLFLGLHGKDLLQGGNLMVLGHYGKYHIQLFLRQHLGVGLGLDAVFGQNLRDFLGCGAEIRRYFSQTILNETHIRTSKINSSSFLGSCGTCPCVHFADGPSPQVGADEPGGFCPADPPVPSGISPARPAPP